ncbi:ABC transporter permease [Taibaiella sp. KBW10]|uniref:ABC transporter permease n=1 Tax=Taibaiella sp. KBW10 TaxID=2153357 RepID=UPI000F5A5B20|nr:ABC transporter permease [Taibaiella sp. KBW10]RQO30931.1 ABC transporter permease [Taibaiella sp. KBW10]
MSSTPTEKPYSQFKAFLALTKASVKSMLKSPSSVVFSLAFPLVFILVFGFMGGNRSVMNVSLHPQADTANPVFLELRHNPLVNLNMSIKDTLALKEQLKKGTIATVLNIQKDPKQAGKYTVDIQASVQKLATADQLQAIINQSLLDEDSILHHRAAEIVAINKTVIAARPFKTIDFILPGQLGFSLLAASVFGTAFVFYHMRQMLVLKRFFATPIKRSNMLLSEGVARLIFQLLGALLIILIGKFFFDYTLINGLSTVLSMLFVSGIALLVFMSFGFVISGIAKSDATIPPLANIFTMPQFLLAGTFFSIDALPKWLQYIAKLMPLTYFNNALRAIAFDGASLWQVKWDILILLIWGVIGYALAAKLFKWE